MLLSLGFSSFVVIVVVAAVVATIAAAALAAAALAAAVEPKDTLCATGRIFENPEL